MPSAKINTGEYARAVSKDYYLVDPRAIIIDWNLNYSRDGEMPDAEDIEKMESSILTQGQIQPIVVEKVKDHQLRAVIGFCRLQAILNLVNRGETSEKFNGTVKVIIDQFTDAEKIIRNIVENEDRIQTKPIQTAKAMKRLKDQCGMSNNQIGERMGKSQTFVHTYLNMNSLPEMVQNDVKSGDTAVSAALELAKLPTEEAKEIFEEVKAESTNGKVSHAAVKNKAREKGAPVPRTLVQLKEFLRAKNHEDEPEIGRLLAQEILKWVEGTGKDKELNKAWDLLVMANVDR